MIGTKNIIIKKRRTKNQKKNLKGLKLKLPIFIGIKNIFKSIIFLTPKIRFFIFNMVDECGTYKNMGL